MTPNYQVVVSPAAQRQLRGLPITILRSLEQAILALAGEPRPRGCLRLRGSPHWRIRINTPMGSYRAIYHIDDAERVVTVVKVARRSERTYRDI